MPPDETRRGARAAAQAAIEWDEKGTRAGAATAIVVSKSIGPLERFIADRPFVYFLIHQPTETILFVGICNDPRS